MGIDRRDFRIFLSFVAFNIFTYCVWRLYELTNIQQPAPLCLPFGNVLQDPFFNSINAHRQNHPRNNNTNNWVFSSNLRIEKTKSNALRIMPGETICQTLIYTSCSLNYMQVVSILEDTNWHEVHFSLDFRWHSQDKQHMYKVADVYDRMMKSTTIYELSNRTTSISVPIPFNSVTFPLNAEIDLQFCVTTRTNAPITIRAVTLGFNSSSSEDLLLRSARRSAQHGGKTLVDEKTKILQKENHFLSVVAVAKGSTGELLTPIFCEYLSDMLEDHIGKENFEVIIVNQTDNLPFNRAFLFNVGAWNASKQADYYALHDLDLLPFEYSDYTFPPIDSPQPLTTELCNYLYPFGCQPRLYKENVGGVLKISKHVYDRVNGMSNLFWGWGGEGKILF